MTATDSIATPAMSVRVAAENSTKPVFRPDRYGCFNRRPYDDAYVDRGHSVIKNVFQRDCQYTLSPAGPTDPRCMGCRWKKEVNHGTS